MNTTLVAPARHFQSGLVVPLRAFFLNWSLISTACATGSSFFWLLTVSPKGPSGSTALLPSCGQNPLLPEPGAVTCRHNTCGPSVLLPWIMVKPLGQPG